MNAMSDQQASVKLDHFLSHEAVLSDAECDRIESYTRDLTLIDAGTTSRVGELHDDVRKTKVGWIKPSEELRWLYEKLYAFANSANKELWNFALSEVAGNLQYAVYDRSGSHYGWHMDLGVGPTATRKIAIVVLLSNADDFEGGDLVILNNVEPQQTPKSRGAVVVFPSYMMHKVTPVTRGVRKSLVLWISGPPFR